MIAQAFPILFSPIISRLYTPETLGLLGLFLSFQGIIAPAITLAYAYAIVLPRTDRDAWALFRLSFQIMVLIVGLLFVPFTMYRHHVARLFQAPTIGVFLPLLLPLLVASGIDQIMQQWMIRKHCFRMIGFVTALTAITASIMKVILGFYWPTVITLILLSVGMVVFRGILLWNAFCRHPPDVSSEKLGDRHHLVTVAKHYIDFPKYRSPQLILNAISQNIPILLLAAFFNPAAVGMYALSQRVLKMPLSMISSSLGKVLLPHMAKSAQHKDSLRPQLIKATSILGLIGFLPITVIIAFGPSIFGLVFGENWIQAGHFARWLAPWLFLGFLNVPSVQAIPILGLQKEFLFFEIGSTALRTLAIVAGSLISQNAIQAIMLYAISGIFVNILLIICVIYASNCPKRML